MKLRNEKIAVILACLISIGGAINADAHSGRTDANGGHKDNKNKSGLGSYNYHCGGNPPHLHTNGCPYSAKPTTTTDSGSSTKVQSEQDIKKAEEAKKKAEEARIQKEKEETNKKGYEAGLREGYERKENVGDKYEGTYKEEYLSGYNKGFQEGSDKIEKEIKSAGDEGYKTKFN